ncbi:unnamed protein product [Nezara viridula]|uniref:Uncharacterized protein n=1 Tax=Nezara viridula TaxID=85310 RepID=A0A9P0H4C3_NEZVI|nr:unnamed protein product [Nezara viridula]
MLLAGSIICRNIGRNLWIRNLGKPQNVSTVAPQTTQSGPMPSPPLPPLHSTLSTDLLYIKAGRSQPPDYATTIDDFRRKLGNIHNLAPAFKQVGPIHILQENESTVLMDPKIGWFQTEQEGPSKEYWMKVWDNFQRTVGHVGSKTVAERKSQELGTSQHLPLQQQQKENLEGADPANVWNNNWASTYFMNRHRDNLIGNYGGCPWRPPNKLYDSRPIVA